MDFFDNKTTNIYQQLHHTTSPLNAFTIPCPFPFSCFSAFSAVDKQFVSELVTNSRPTTCLLDPMPTPLTKSCLPVLCPLPQKIINTSLLSGSVPTCLKTAAVTPILKKPGTDQEHFNWLYWHEATLYYTKARVWK